MLGETALFALGGARAARFMPTVALFTEEPSGGTNTSAHAMRSQRTKSPPHPGITRSPLLLYLRLLPKKAS
jgi:hypothetical protein